MNTWRRRLLALLSVPLLAIPSAAGVYLWLEPHIGKVAAGMTAAGFESLYIGINILIITTPELRRYARNVALSGVVTAVIFNTLARYQKMVGGDLRAVPLDALALGLAVLESIPLAGLAYAVSVLLHRLSEADVQTRASDVRLRVELAQRDEEIARLRTETGEQAGDLAQWTERAAQHGRAAEQWRANAERAADEAAQVEQVMGAEIARLRAELAERDSEIARLRDEIAQAGAAGGLDLPAIAQALQSGRALSWREIEALLGVAQSTLRSQLKARERRNGHAAPVTEA